MSQPAKKDEAPAPAPHPPVPNLSTPPLSPASPTDVSLPALLAHVQNISSMPSVAVGMPVVGPAVSTNFGVSALGAGSGETDSDDGDYLDNSEEEEEEEEEEEDEDKALAAAVKASLAEAKPPAQQANAAVAASANAAAAAASSAAAAAAPAADAEEIARQQMLNLRLQFFNSLYEVRPPDEPLWYPFSAPTLPANPYDPAADPSLRCQVLSEAWQSHYDADFATACAPLMIEHKSVDAANKAWDGLVKNVRDLQKQAKVVHYLIFLLTRVYTNVQFRTTAPSQSNNAHGGVEQ